MRVAIDCRFAATESGLGRYTREMARHLLLRDDAVEYVLLTRGAAEPWLRDLPQRFTQVTVPHKHYSLGEQLLLPSIVRSTGADIFFAMHFNVPWFCPVPFVATIHDLILHAYPNDAGALKSFVYRLLMKRTVRRARSLVAVSRFVAEELGRTYGAGVADKLTVIREGAGEAFHPRSQEEQARACAMFGIERPFYLYVGNAKQHKNVQVLLDAYAAAGDTGRDLILVTAGEEASSLRMPKGARRITGVVDDALAALYSAADAFVTASLYEGFCLPVLEASQCGCPIIAARTSAIPEIVPQGSALPEPTVEAFSLALRTPPVRPVKAVQASWEKAAEQVAASLLSA